MFVYALFDNCTAEEVRLTLISQGVNEPLNIIVKATGKNNNNINLKNSAIRGIQTAHNTVFSESIGKYRYNKNITVSPFFFSNQIDGDSATLAFAISYAVHLAKEGKIKCRLPEIKVAATGDLLLNGDVLKIESLKEKVIAAINEGISLLLYPSDNLQDLTNARQNDADFDRMIRESKITLKHVSTIHQALGEIGILDKTVFSINYTVKESKKISLSIFISNPNMYRINDFVLAISGIKGITAISFRDNSISTTVFNDILYVKFDSKNQVERSINCKSVKFIIDVSTDQIQDNFIIEFVKKYCIINGVNLEDMAGFNFVSNKVEFRKNYAYKPIAPKKKSRKVLLPVIIALLLYLMTPSIVLNTLSTLINYKDSTGKTWLINKELVRSEGTIAKNVKKNYLCFSELSDVTKDGNVRNCKLSATFYLENNEKFFCGKFGFPDENGAQYSECKLKIHNSRKVLYSSEIIKGGMDYFDINIDLQDSSEITFEVALTLNSDYNVAPVFKDAYFTDKAPNIKPDSKTKDSKGVLLINKQISSNTGTATINKKNNYLYFSELSDVIKNDNNRNCKLSVTYNLTKDEKYLSGKFGFLDNNGDYSECKLKIYNSNKVLYSSNIIKGGMGLFNIDLDLQNSPTITLEIDLTLYDTSSNEVPVFKDMIFTSKPQQVQANTKSPIENPLISKQIVHSKGVILINKPNNYFYFNILSDIEKSDDVRKCKLSVTYDLDEGEKFLSGKFGFLDGRGEYSECKLKIFNSDKVLYSSEIIKGGMGLFDIDVDLLNSSQITLELDLSLYDSGSSDVPVFKSMVLSDKPLNPKLLPDKEELIEIPLIKKQISNTNGTAVIDRDENYIYFYRLSDVTEKGKSRTCKLSITYNLNEGENFLKGKFGFLNNKNSEYCECKLTVYNSDKVLYSSDIIKGNDGLLDINIDLEGSSSITLDVYFTYTKGYYWVSPVFKSMILTNRAYPNL